MTPEQAIRDLPHLVGRVEALRAEVAGEARYITTQWAVLCGMGACRADHAAELLGKLDRSLRHLEEFAGNCREQLRLMQANPFSD